jgi:acyl-CoA reductase-like NAD-dependent aldehyde dehydrogenase
LFSAFFNAGQICTTGSRLLVEESFAAEFTERLAQAASALRVGDPTSEQTDLGPLVDGRQLERVREYIRVGSEEGAKILYQGKLESDHRGHFVAPLIFSSVTPQMRIAQEEIFGPVLSVLTFRDEADAIAKANGIAYGLSASVWTNHLGRAMRMAHAVQAGIIWINNVEYWEPSVPYSGQKQSGFGEDLGLESFHTYTKAKSVFVNVTGAKLAWGTSA